MGEERTELTGRIREDIERTRADMSWTMGEIEDRLKPQRLVRQARERVRGAAVERMKDMMNSANETAGRVAGRARHSADAVADRVRENPIPLAAVAAAGVAWWMSRDKPQFPRAAHGDEVPRQPSQLTSVMGDHPVQTVLLAGTVGYLLMNRSWRTDGRDRATGLGGTVERSAQDLTELAGPDMTERAAETARQAGESVSEARKTLDKYVKEARSTAVETSGRLKEKARHIAGDVQQRWQHTGPTVERWIHDNPLAFGAAALAVGAAVGLSAPRTRAENRTLGETRDALMDKATTAVRDVRAKAKSVVQDVSDAAKAAMPPSSETVVAPSSSHSAVPSPSPSAE